MKEKPLVSIVIPNYNRASLLKGAIESIQNQTYRPVEIVIVDDASTDQSKHVIQQLSETYDHVSYEILPQNCGANYCRNVGVERANGEYISFLDSDDAFCPTKIEKQMDVILNQDNIGFVVTGFGENRLRGVRNGVITLKDIIKENNIGGFSVLLVKKSLLKSVGGLDDSLKSGQDWDLYLKLLQMTKGYKISEQLVSYTLQDDSISKNINNFIQGYSMVSKRALDLNATYQFYDEKILASYQHYYIGMRYYLFKDMANMRKALKQSINIKPNRQAIFYLVTSYLGYSLFSKMLRVKKHLTKFIIRMNK